MNQVSASPAAPPITTRATARRGSLPPMRALTAPAIAERD